ncbi:MAG: phosphonate ABC transporter, permease protein PhnE [Armatimonadetes bacterium]|nr:phosphonate ABC transporter, permease protein PhnE [Armatimonadota bacterium]
MRCVTPNGKPSAPTWWMSASIGLVFALSGMMIQVDLPGLARSPGPLATFVGRMWVAPDFSYLPRLAALTLETVVIAFVATVASCLLSFPISLLAARNCTPHPVVGWLLKAVASIFRAVPDLLVALVLASALGLGNVPGVLALVTASVAYLVKAYADALEVTGKNPVEGVAASGGGWLAQRTVGVVPQAAPDLLGLSLYAMDSNLRSASFLGAVGAGGIGFDLAAAVRHFQFDRLGAMILSIFLSVSLVDALSSHLRRRIG